MLLQTFNPNKHWEQIQNLFKQYDWVSPSLDVLPSTGYVVESEHSGLVLAACFVYESNSKMCFLDWIIADSTVDTNIRRSAVSSLMQHAISSSMKNGYTHIYTVTANTKLADNMVNHMGFTEMEKGATTLLYTNSKEKDFLK